MPTLKNNPFTNITAGSRATLILPVNGPTYHFVLLQLVTLTLADLVRIRVRLNSKIIKEINSIDAGYSAGELLQAFNIYKGDMTTDGFLTLDFTEMLAKELADELSGVIPTAFGVSNLSVEIDIKSGATISEGDLDSWSEISGLVPNPVNALANIQHLVPSTHNFQGANTYDVDLPHGVGSGHLIKRLWLVKTSGAGEIAAVELRKNNLPIKETTKAMNDFILARYDGILDATFYCLDLVAANHTIGGLLTTKDAGDLRLKVKTTGSVVCDIYLESLADLALI